MRLQSRHWLGAGSSEGSTGAEGATFKTVHAPRCWQEASVPLHLDLAIVLLEHPHSMVAGSSLPGPINWVIQERHQEGSQRAFYFLVTPALFYAWKTSRWVHSPSERGELGSTCWINCQRIQGLLLKLPHLGKYRYWYSLLCSGYSLVVVLGLRSKSCCVLSHIECLAQYLVHSRCSINVRNHYFLKILFIYLMNLFGCARSLPCHMGS